MNMALFVSEITHLPGQSFAASLFRSAPPVQACFKVFAEDENRHGYIFFSVLMRVLFDNGLSSYRRLPRMTPQSFTLSGI